MEKVLLLGDEAIAQGFIDAGGSAINSYPGTPSTQITEYVINSKQAKEQGVIANWCANEKTALEASIGVAYAGKRAMTCMKHVGLNVCGDPFMNAAIIGTKGVLVVVADDPSMFSSQDEQDSRYYGHWAMIPMLEPSNQQEAYDMVHYGYELSEQLGTALAWCASPSARRMNSPNPPTPSRLCCCQPTPSVCTATSSTNNPLSKKHRPTRASTSISMARRRISVSSPRVSPITT